MHRAQDRMRFSSFDAWDVESRAECTVASEAWGIDEGGRMQAYLAALTMFQSSGSAMQTEAYEGTNQKSDS